MSSSLTAEGVAGILELLSKRLVTQDQADRLLRKPNKARGVPKAELRAAAALRRVPAPSVDGLRPRPVSRIVADREIIAAFKRGELVSARPEIAVGTRVRWDESIDGYFQGQVVSLLPGLIRVSCGVNGSAWIVSVPAGNARLV
jgi:hypothetical protein